MTLNSYGRWLPLAVLLGTSVLAGSGVAIASAAAPLSAGSHAGAATVRGDSRLVLKAAGGRIGLGLTATRREQGEQAVSRSARGKRRSSAASIYWGAWIDGAQYGFQDAPWDMRTVAAFEATAGKSVSIIHFGQPWSSGGQLQPFFSHPLDQVRTHGAIPLVDWSSSDIAPKNGAPRRAFPLASIANGTDDAYITAWALGAKEWGHPFFLRFDHEMNGNWFPWGVGVGGNTAAQYVAAWRHVHDIFTGVGATNVTWVWSPNVDFPGGAPLDSLYPGDAYVDWVAMDGYNAARNPTTPRVWKSFSSVFGETYRDLGKLAPTKPIMIAEMASAESGGSKATWIRNALGAQLAAGFPDVKAVVWFDWAAKGEDWPTASSASASKAFATAIASGYFAKADFGDLTGSVIRPLQN